MRLVDESLTQTKVPWLLHPSGTTSNWGLKGSSLGYSQQQLSTNYLDTVNSF